MLNPNTARIVYPTLAERLEQLRKSGTTFGAMARRLDVEEATVIGWSNGVMPGTKIRGRITERFDYSFTERRFAEAAADAAFPPDDAPEVIQSIRTHVQLLAYLDGIRSVVVDHYLAAFFGMKARTFTGMFAHPEFAPDREHLAAILRKLSDLARHLTGDVLSECTPRAVLGQMLRDVRLRYAESLQAFARRVGITPELLQFIEAKGRGQEWTSSRGPRTTTRQSGGYFQHREDLDRILAFLEKERPAIRPAPAAPAAASLASPAPPRAPVVPARAGTDWRAVRDRLQALVDRVNTKRAAALLGIPRTTLNGVLNHPQQAKRTTIARIAAALDAHEPVSATPEPQTPDVGATQSVEQRLAELEARFQRLTAGGGNASSSVDSGGYVSPLSRERFQPHDAPVSDGELASARTEIRRVSEQLGHLASIANDTVRRRVQAALAADVDELFDTMEGFLREYPSGALVTLDSQRRFHAEQRGRLIAGPDSAPLTRKGDE
ncbi:MAG: hypothetical protein Q8S13_07955 [Dehalococcoidia bacterium]|nr:hypothetical protein [Dehalococcoidia bacterium]